MKLLYLLYVVGYVYCAQIACMETSCDKEKFSKAMHLIARIYFDTIEEVNKELINARSGLKKVKQDGQAECAIDSQIRDFATRISQFYAYNNCQNKCTNEHEYRAEELLYDFDQSTILSCLGSWHFSETRIIKCERINVDFNPMRVWNILIKNRMLQHIDGEEVQAGRSLSPVIKVLAVRYGGEEIKLSEYKS